MGNPVIVVGGKKPGRLGGKKFVEAACGATPGSGVTIVAPLLAFAALRTAWRNQLDLSRVNRVGSGACVGVGRRYLRLQRDTGAHQAYYEDYGFHSHLGGGEANLFVDICSDGGIA